MTFKFMHVVDYKGGHHYFDPRKITDIYTQNNDEDTEFYVVLEKFRIIVMKGKLKEMEDFVKKVEKNVNKNV